MKSNIEFKIIPGALDKDKDIVVDGEVVGTVSRGWLRNGGEQWVASLKGGQHSAFGEKSLKMMKRAIAHKLGIKLNESTLSEVIDYGYYEWSEEQFYDLAKAVWQYAAENDVDLETGEGYEEFFQRHETLGYASNAALEMIDSVLSAGSVSNGAIYLKGNANWERYAQAITDMIELIGFEATEPVTEDREWKVVGHDEWDGFEIWNNGGKEFEVTLDGEVVDRFYVSQAALRQASPEKIAMKWVKKKNTPELTEGRLLEGSYKGDLQRLVTPELHIDQHRSKMGEDDDIIVVSFKVTGKEPAQDLVSFLETGYDFILDADASPGEVSPGDFLVFFELSRRTRAPEQIYKIVEEVLNLTLQEMDEWKFAYGRAEERGTRSKVELYPFTLENLKSMIPLSPREYRDTRDEYEPMQDDDEIAAMKNIAQIPVNQEAPHDEEMDTLRQQAGLL